MPLVHELKSESLLSFTFYVVKDVHFFSYCSGSQSGCV